MGSLDYQNPNQNVTSLEDLVGIDETEVTKESDKPEEVNTEAVNQ